ncbi:MAG TPA: 3-oxoacyl-ACP reductase family protein [Smithellaceae bacterium]|jgi:3-oxoacyl-[acyl-carrier protein] reductase|nr:3-oxoacyl-ACP reductase family protein [Smithellaceae bacterium]HNT90460.1 3-oxoacyl-ACP reductase family protein [Smithellaceae bacterium]HNV63696.1 3-oxoacyl-ACP reductase family protein [Smithellaceae bacterium]HNZ31334.1 3-oxoacyl-ACP reductase family protein [Smithellaceae bacterium]HOD30872.1 3-oxoacyl-ACP reductase family protein [Smithellaceae bacterium]
MDKPVAIVTGGGTGIGAACSRALAKEGFRVGINYIPVMEEPSKVVLAEIKEGFLVEADLTDPEQIDKMVGEIKEVAGRVDVLVNSAGISINSDINSMKIEEFDRQRELVRGAWYLTKRILRQFMLRANSGRIINISSVVGHTGNPGQIPYTMEKAALDAFTKSLSKELWGRNILVNSVAPGFIDTAMTRELPEEVKEKMMSSIPLARLGQPEEIADVVAFLATRGTYITGTVIHVNGGIYGG